MKGKIEIKRKKGLRGDDGYRTFSVRIKEETMVALDAIVQDSNRSRNDLINIMLEYGVNHYELTD